MLTSNTTGCAVAPYLWHYYCTVCGMHFIGGPGIVQTYADHTWTHV